MATPERVVIAAAGVVTPIGQDLEAFWSGAGHRRLGHLADRALPGGRPARAARRRGQEARPHQGLARRARLPRDAAC